jgi:hypothetical protein
VLLDRTIIETRVAIHPELLANPKQFVRDQDLTIRNLKPGRMSHSPIHLDVLTFKGIGIDIYPQHASLLSPVRIEFNPSKCLYGHNGRVIDCNNFIDALGILVHHLSPLLNDPCDWVHLLPGVIPQGRAFWQMLEIMLQVRDKNNQLLDLFRNAHCARRKAGRVTQSD